MVSRSRRPVAGDPDITAEEAGGIGRRIRGLRGTATQVEFARRLGIAREHLSRLESGSQVPGGGTLRRLAEVTGVSVDFVLLGAGRPAAAGEGGGWAADLGALLGATSLRPPRPFADGSRLDRAWDALPDATREEVRALVRRVAVIALALESTLPPRAARAVLDELSEALGALLVDRILAQSVS